MLGYWTKGDVVVARFRLILATLLTVLVGLSACTSVPIDDLNTYDKAFTQAQLAGDLLLDKVSPIVAAEGGNKAGCTVNVLGYHNCFDPLGVLSKGKSDDPRSILVRRAALQTIADYNSALLAIADGRFAVGGTTQINDLVESGKMLLQLSSAVVPGLPGLLTDASSKALGALVSQIQGARSAYAVRNAIIAGAPVVQKMLGALAGETPLLYEIYSKAKKSEYIDEKTTAAEKKTIIAEINAFYDSLAKYVDLLNTTSIALDSLATASNRPAGTADLRAIITSATEIKDKADAFWKAARAFPK